MVDLSGLTSLDVRVTPNASKTRITRQEGEVFFIHIKAPPEDGKANAELERFLSKLSGKTAKVILGKSGKRKRVLLR